MVVGRCVEKVNSVGPLKHLGFAIILLIPMISMMMFLMTEAMEVKMILMMDKIFSVQRRLSFDFDGVNNDNNDVEWTITPMIMIMMTMVQR